MKTTATRFAAVAALALALFAPTLNVGAEGYGASGGRPPIPSSNCIVQVTSTDTIFSTGLSVDNHGTIIAPDGTAYYSYGNAIVYPDGTTVYPNGTISYPSGATVTLTTY